MQIRNTATKDVKFKLDEAALANLAKIDASCVDVPPVEAAASEVRWLGNQTVEFKLMCRDKLLQWFKRPYKVVRTKDTWLIPPGDNAAR